MRITDELAKQVRDMHVDFNRVRTWYCQVGVQKHIDCMREFDGCECPCHARWDWVPPYGAERRGAR